LRLKRLRVFQPRVIVVETFSPYSLVASMRKIRILRMHPIVVVWLIAMRWHIMPLIAEWSRHHSKLMLVLDLVTMILRRIVAWVLIRGGILYVLVRISEGALGREIHLVNVV
jgi:hypothetical protein